MQIFVDDAFKGVVIIFQPEAAQRIGQRVARDLREILVATHQRAQPGIFKLLDAPHLRDDPAIAGKLVFGDVSHRLDIVERAIGIEDDCFDGHGDLSLPPMVAYRKSLTASIDRSRAVWLNSR